MSLPRYPEYKDSGVAWLGEVPEHWEVKRLGYYFTERREKVSDKDFEPLSVTKNGILPQLETAAKTDDGDNRKKVCMGDFVINSRSDRKGSSGMALLDGSVSLINTVIQPQKEMRIEFAHHLLRSIPFQEEYYRYGKGIVADLWSTNYSEMKNIDLAAPPVAEQQTIAAFLDRETGKIDALIAEQRRLVELLAEKRQAVISHAVTKGLGTRHSHASSRHSHASSRHSRAGGNPAEKTNPQSGQGSCPATQESFNQQDSLLRGNDGVVMKDSGIEWLGVVPEHWEVKRIKHGLCLLTEKTDRRDNPIALENIEGWSGRFIPTGTEFQGEGVAFESGDILFGKLRPYLAKVYLTESSGEAVGDFHVLRPAQKMDGSFVVYQMLNRDFITIVDSSTFGAKMPRVAWEFMSNIMLPVPPLEEQQTIAAFLDTETAKFDTLTAEANRAIELLQERRSALISAAVTGKIDVRATKI